MDYNEFNKKFPLNIEINEVVEIDEACWKGYKQLGMKKKGEKEVPNCVKESDDCKDEDEKVEKDEKESKKRKSKIDLNPKLDMESV